MEYPDFDRKSVEGCLVICAGIGKVGDRYLLEHPDSLPLQRDMLSQETGDKCRSKESATQKIERQRKDVYPRVNRQ